jgi:hypothetical protein
MPRRPFSSAKSNRLLAAAGMPAVTADLNDVLIARRLAVITAVALVVAHRARARGMLAFIVVRHIQLPSFGILPLRQ